MELTAELYGTHINTKYYFNRRMTSNTYNTIASLSIARCGMTIAVAANTATKWKRRIGNARVSTVTFLQKTTHFTSCNNALPLPLKLHSMIACMARSDIEEYYVQTIQQEI